MASALQVKPLIKQSHHIILADDGDICIGEIPEVSQIIENPPKWVAEVLKRLDGKHTIPRIIKEISIEDKEIDETSVYAFIDELDQLNLLQNNGYFSSILNNEEIERYNRQILQFSLIDADKQPPYVYQERLKDSNVAIFGMGGWGTWCSLVLAQAGIGKLRIIDGDHVELSNINRQVLYRTKDIGKEKVFAAKDCIGEINPNVEVTCFHEFAKPDTAALEQLIGKANFIIIAWAALGYYRKDTVEEIIHEIAEKKQIPILELGGDPLEVSIGPIYPYNRSHASFKEVQSNQQQSFYNSDPQIKKFQQARLKQNFLDGEREVNAWQSAPSLAAMAGLACDQLIKYLTKYDKSSLIGKRIFINLSTYEKREQIIFE